MPRVFNKEQRGSNLMLFTGLGRTLFVSLLLFSLLPLSVGGLLGYYRGHTILLEKEVESLEAAVNLRTFYLESYVKERINDLILQAGFSENILLLQQLKAAFSSSDLPLDQFIKTSKYISIVTDHGDDIQEFQKLSESYHDILLVDPQGNVLYSVAAEENLGTNIFTDQYRDTELVKVIRKTIELRKTLCSDLRYRQAFGKQGSLFTTRLMVDEWGDMIGIMVMQIYMDQINNIMSDSSGLGGTGQVFLVGVDRTLRSRLRSSETTPVLSEKIRSPLITEWLLREKTRHASGQTHDKTRYPILSATKLYQGQSQNKVLGLSRDIDNLGIYDVHWMMIAEIDEDEAVATSRELGRMTLSTLLVTAVLVSFLAAFLTKRIILPLSTITAWARKVAQGDLTVQEIKTQDNEIGTLYQALTEMVGSLNEMMSQKDQQDWLKSGETGLNKTMQGIQDISILEQNILNYICDYLQFQVGAFFLLEDESLHLAASYAYNITSGHSHEFAMGEGLVGQAALRKKTVIFNEVPGEHFHLEISSGLGSSSPQAILVLPLLHENEVLGVLEFASIRSFSEQEIAFLENISSVVAITLKTALASQKVKRLLEEETLRQGHELEKRQEELEISNKELQTKAIDLELASKYKSEFLANMSHELRSPLNSLLILAQSLADNDQGNLTDDQVVEARIIHSSGLDLLTLINDILDLSKIESGRIEIHYAEMTFISLVQDLENQFMPLAKDKGLGFGIHLSPELGSVMVTDEQRLKQILTNLLANGMKFTSTGSVSLSVLPALAQTHFHSSELINVETVAFEVIDTGIGIAESKQEQIFEAFQQGDGSTSRQYSGTGLGLSISRQFAELMGGEILLESNLGNGTIFTLFLPAEGQAGISRPAVGTASELPFVSGNSIESSSGGERIVDTARIFQNKKILVVDDDMRNSFAMASLLKKYGIKVELAGNGKQALEKLADHHDIDLVLMDIMMPEMDGYEASRRIRDQQCFKELPIIALTAKAMPDDYQHCLDAGANDYLTKPVNQENLFDLIRVWLVRSAVPVHEDSE